MNIQITSRIERVVALVILVHDGKLDLGRHSFASSFTREDKAYLTVLLKKTPVKPGVAHVVLLPSGKQIVLLGVDAGGKFTHRKAIIAVRHTIHAARGMKIDVVQFCLNDFVVRRQRTEDIAEMIAMQCELANFEFNRYKTVPKEGWNSVKQIFVYSTVRGKEIGTALTRGKIIGEEINKARALSNTPAGDMTPKTLADEAVRVGRAYGIRAKILDEGAMRKLRMGGVLGVAQGSNERPKFIIMEYMKGKKSDKPFVLVGKGVTFDSGGLNVKTGDYMNEMHMDMSGGAAVIHTLAALARLKTKANIVALVPAVENMPSGSSYRPGDVLKTMSGKTIEVNNTDAEGRVILADALTYAQKYSPRLIVDVATLTGAAEVALGQRASALFSTDEKISREMIAAGEETGDFVWPMPLWEEYEDDIKGTFGDVSNTGKTRYGGAITGAVFLWQFMKKRQEDRGKGKEEIPWVHLDIAPRMTSIEGDYLAKGAAGASIALLTRFLREF